MRVLFAHVGFSCQWIPQTCFIGDEEGFCTSQSPFLARSSLPIQAFAHRGTNDNSRHLRTFYTKVILAISLTLTTYLLQKCNKGPKISNMYHGVYFHGSL